MSMALTRFGANDPTAPAALPSLTSALSRRRAIFGAVALVSAPAAAAPAIITPSLDAELFALLARHPIAVERWLAARKVADAVERVAVAARPERPKALLHKRSDFPRTTMGWSLSRHDNGEGPRVYGERASAWLRDRPSATWFRTLVPPLGPECEARRLEILEAFDAHAAACRAVDERVGLTAAEEAAEAAYEALSGIETRLNDLVPRTAAGLAAKAEWAADSEDEGVMEMVLRQVAAFGLAA